MTTSRWAAGLSACLLLALCARAAALPEEGLASWYGLPFHGRKTASGEIFDRFAFTAAHRSLPFGSVLIVTALDSGMRVVVRVNDRGPFVKGRLIDLSEAAARELALTGSGVGRVKIEDGAGMAPGPLGGPALSAGKAGLAGRAPFEAGAAPAAESVQGARPSAGSAAERKAGGQAEGSRGRRTLCDIQVASFSKEENARRALERLRAAGFLPEEARSGQYIRVRIRDIPAEEAEAARKRLSDLGFPGVMLSFREALE
jgi:rare lipoprotein A